MNALKNIPIINVYTLSQLKDNKWFNNSKFIEDYNLSIVVDELRKEFKPSENYSGADVINKIILYLNQSRLPYNSSNKTNNNI